jgi:PAS domain-containing protein
VGGSSQADKVLLLRIDEMLIIMTPGTLHLQAKGTYDRQKQPCHADHAASLGMNSASDAFIVVNRANEVIEWSEKAEKLFGWKRDEAVGRTLSALIIPAKMRAP